MKRKIENYEDRLSYLSTVFYTNMHKRASEIGHSIKWLSAHSGVSEASLLSKRWLTKHRGISLSLAIRIANTLGVTIAWLVADHGYDEDEKAEETSHGKFTDEMLEDIKATARSFSLLRGVQKKALILHAFSYLDYDPFTADLRAVSGNKEKPAASVANAGYDDSSIEPLGDEEVKERINGIITRLNETIDRKRMTKSEIGEKLGISLSVVSASLLPDSTRNTDLLRMLDYIDAVGESPERILDGLEASDGEMTKNQKQAQEIMLLADSDMAFAFRNCLSALDADEIRAVRIHAESYV